QPREQCAPFATARNKYLKAVPGEGKDFPVGMLHHLLMWPMLYLVQDGEQRPRPGLQMQMVWGRRPARRPVVEHPVCLSQRRGQVEQRPVTAYNVLGYMGACRDDQMVGQYGKRVAENDESIPPGQPPLLQRQMLGTQKTAPGAD